MLDQTGDTWEECVTDAGNQFEHDFLESFTIH